MHRTEESNNPSFSKDWGRERDRGQPDPRILSRADSENMSPWHPALSPDAFPFRVDLFTERSQANVKKNLDGLWCSIYTAW